MPDERSSPMATTAAVSQNILFSEAKKELFSPSSGYRSLQARLKAHWSVGVIRDEVTLEKVGGARMVVFGCPRDKFSVAEFTALRSYLEGGGSVVVMLGEGGETKLGTNVNFLLEEFGIALNSDSVTRTAYHKFHHPKEALVTNGVLNRELGRAAGKSDHTHSDSVNTTLSQKSLSFVYPFGGTLTVQKPAVSLLSSGSTSYPLCRPVAAFCHSKNGRGRLLVLGSAHLFSDQYLDKEENGRLQEVLWQLMTSDDITLNAIDAEDPEVSDYHFLPETGQAAERVQSCLQESEEVPREFSSLIDHSLFRMDMSVLPDCLQAYTDLGLKHETLTLIQPTFETPLPPLQPALFPPSLHEPPPPSLDLFDLDQEFSSERTRIAQITNKCSDEDLEYYVRQCGDIMGVSSRLPSDKRTAKHILEHVLTQVAEFKKSTQT
ncbi:Intraflagellar transport protein 52 homolog [Geodia barretti]|uniref:Intraflagellar transport protein 52 homolog n=2 Tax=Geodia barretti TaxID=519541 RepID=A0AA35X8H4_GEOBA|nr:Intraflagellar transport protein 52 homolog [Geodia barretti]